MMLTKKKLTHQYKRLLKRYAVIVEYDLNITNVYFFRNDVLKARIKSEWYGDDIWEVVSVNSKVGGLGKFLYYVLMDFVYPFAIIPDSMSCDPPAKRIYTAFNDLSYVNRLPTKTTGIVNELGMEYEYPYLFNFSNNIG